MPQLTDPGMGAGWLLVGNHTQLGARLAHAQGLHCLLGSARLCHLIYSH